MSPRLSRENHPHWQLSELVGTLLSKAAQKVVSTWLSDLRFRDAEGEPALLSLATGGQGEGFIRLVALADRRLTPATVLDELLCLGLVERHDSGHLLLRRVAYGPLKPADAGFRQQPPERTVFQAGKRYNDFNR